MNIVKNQEVILEITGTSHDGSGVSRCNNMVIFIPGCVEGDRVKAKIVGVKKSYAFAKLLEVVNPSPHRISVDCASFLKCGGCVFRHLSYEQELRIKYQRVRDALVKIAGLSIQPDNIEGSPLIEGYRNKAQFPVEIGDNGVHIGFFAPRSHRVIDSTGCRLQPPVFDRVLMAFRKWIIENGISLYDESTGQGLLRHVFIRQAETTGELMACAVINGEKIPNSDGLISDLCKEAPNTVSIILNINQKKTNVILGNRCKTIWGKDKIIDMLGGKKFEISPLSFYQVNSKQALRLYETAADFAKPKSGELLLDLYCGAGTIGIFMSDRVGKVIGIESVPEAVEDARRNAEINGLDNAEFICSDAGEAAAQLERDGIRPDIVVVDPPRKGCSGQTIHIIADMGPTRVVYVSCDPATLARDLAIFDQVGYKCIKVKPFDMFPRTAHVECCALLERV